MAANNKSTGTVTIVGDTAKIGTTLLIGGVSINDKDGLGDLHYQWLSNGNPIEQETGNRYTLTKNDIGKILNVKVSYIDGADNAETVKSTNTKKVAAPVNNKPTGTITITGDATKVGTELSITNTIKDKDGLGEFNYQWLRDGKAIASATSDKYTLSQDDKGKTINLQVNYTDGAGYAETVKSANTKKVTAGTTTTTNTTTTTPIKVDLSGPTNVNEGGSATYTATLTKALTSAISVPYALSGTGITINGDEFTGVTSSSGNITIPAGSTTGSFTLNVINDSKTEGAETLTVKLGSMSAGSGVTLGTKSSVATVIADTSVGTTVSTELPVVNLSGPANVDEGSPATYIATLSSPATSEINLRYFISGSNFIGSSNIAGADFTGSHSGTIKIPIGATTGTLTLNINNDERTEGNENATVLLFERKEDGTPLSGVKLGSISKVSTMIVDTSKAIVTTDDYSDSINTTAVLNIGGKTNGNIDFNGDIDTFKVYLQAGVDYSFECSGETLNTTETYFTNVGNVGMVANGHDPLIRYTPTVSGEYYFSVSGGYSIGTYVIKTSILNNSILNISDGTSVLGTSSSDTYNISSGNYDVNIDGFNKGDKLNFFTNAQINVLQYDNFTDGQIQITAVNSTTGETTGLTLTGLTLAQDKGITDVSSFNTVFGDAISTLPTVNLIAPGGGYMGEGTGSYFYFAYLTNGVAPAGGLNIPYAISGNSITASDFKDPYTNGATSLTGTINIPAGKNSGFTILAPTADDSTTEGTETFVLSLGAVSGVKLGTKATTSTLLKDSSETYPTGTHLVYGYNDSNNTTQAAITNGGSTSGVDTFYISSGNSNYSASISNFSVGDKLKFFTGAEINILQDTDQTDGVQVITAYNPIWLQTTTITLTGLTAAQDAGIFNVSSFNSVFGAGALT